MDYSKQDFDKILLNLNGIPTEKHPPFSLYFSYDEVSGWWPNQDFKIYDIFTELHRIDSIFQKKIFSEKDYFDTISTEFPAVLSQGGISSEATISKEFFERYINIVKISSINELSFKALYFYDCLELTYSISENMNQILYLLGEFYRLLNLHVNPKMFHCDDHYSGVILTQSIGLHAILNYIFIKFNSILDLLTKVVFEL